MRSIIITDADQAFCPVCYEAQVNELDAGTHAYAFIAEGTCEGCGEEYKIITKPPVEAENK